MDFLKTKSIRNLENEVVYKRASRIPLPKKINSVECMACGCSVSRHCHYATECSCKNRQHVNCRKCGTCTGFVSQEQINRVYFTEFLRWSKRWVKANKNRSVKQLHSIWSRIQNLNRINYCGTCDTATFVNDVRSVVKAKDGLECASCRQCVACCACVSCKGCHRRKTNKQVCETCGVCNQCCQCKECAVCDRECNNNYCGYSFTDYQKRNMPGCQRCYNCCDCSDTFRVPFGSFDKPKFHKPTLKQHSINPTSRFIAAELECSGIMGKGKPIYDVARKWGAGSVGDGSLVAAGFEINTAPAGGDLYAEQITEICNVIEQQKGMIDAKCGLHVHVDARDMNYYDIRRLVRVYATIEDALFAMVPPSRVEGITDGDGKLHQYCKPCGKTYLAAIEEGRLPYEKIKSDIIYSVYQENDTRALRHRKRHPSRYNALNLHSWFYRGTVECRMFDGCIEPEPIIKWGTLWAMIIDYSVKNTDEAVAREMRASPIEALKAIIDQCATGYHRKNMADFITQRITIWGRPQMRVQCEKVFAAT